MNPIGYILDCIRTIYGIRHKNGAIRRVNVNIAATTVEEYRMLKDAGIGTSSCSETYCKAGAKAHPRAKHDYAWHTEAMDRAMQGGIDDVGLGVLFGLEGYRYEFAALLMHAEHLEAVRGTPSACRASRRPTTSIDVFDNGIDDETFARICACIRVDRALTSAVISTRESQAVRGCCPGRLADQRCLPHQRGQLLRARPEAELRPVRCQRPPHPGRGCPLAHGSGPHPQLLHGLLPRGPHRRPLHEPVQSRQILNCCHPNALLTLKEYLQDYASPATRAVGLDMIRKELDKIPSDKVRARTIRCLDAIEAGQRDFTSGPAAAGLLLSAGGSAQAPRGACLFPSSIPPGEPSCSASAPSPAMPESAPSSPATASREAVCSSAAPASVPALSRAEVRELLFDLPWPEVQALAHQCRLRLRATCACARPAGIFQCLPPQLPLLRPTPREQASVPLQPVGGGATAGRVTGRGRRGGHAGAANRARWPAIPSGWRRWCAASRSASACP